MSKEQEPSSPHADPVDQIGEILLDPHGDKLTRIAAVLGSQEDASATRAMALVRDLAAWGRMQPRARGPSALGHLVQRATRLVSVDPETRSSQDSHPEEGGGSEALQQALTELEFCIECARGEASLERFSMADHDWLSAARLAVSQALTRADGGAGERGGGENDPAEGRALSAAEAVRQIHALLDAYFWPPTLQANTAYTRLHDDHDGTYQGRLSVIIDQDGDARVAALSPDMSGLRFRMPLTGGGASPYTRTALVILAEAIRLDNERRPHSRPPTLQGDSP